MVSINKEKVSRQVCFTRSGREMLFGSFVDLDVHISHITRPSGAGKK
jgi:hypothetical protein